VTLVQFYVFYEKKDEREMIDERVKLTFLFRYVIQTSRLA